MQRIPQRISSRIVPVSSVAAIKAILLFAVLSLITPATALAQKKKQRKTFRERLQIADSLRLQLRQSADRGQMLRWADSLFIDRVLSSKMGEKKKQRLLRQYHKRQARIRRYDRLLFRGDSLLAAKYNKIKYDTAYIARPDARWTVKFTGVLSGADMQTVTKTDALERRTHVMADCRGTFSVAAAYRGLGLSLSVNPAKLAGKNKDYEFNLNSYSNRYGFDVVYLSSKTFHGHRYVDGRRVDVGRGQVSQNALNLNFYYAFNSRRFSFPAAFSQSYVQKRSAGSWMIGASFDGSKTEMKDMTIRLNEFAVGGGYAYNLVVHRHWLFHLSALPTVTVYSHDYTKTRISASGEESAATADAAISDVATTTSAATPAAGQSVSADGTTALSVDESTDSSADSYTYRNSMEYHFPSVIITGRAAVVYSWRNKFAGATAIYNYSVAGDDAHLQLHRNKWRVRMFFGFRF